MRVTVLAAIAAVLVVSCVCHAQIVIQPRRGGAGTGGMATVKTPTLAQPLQPSQTTVRDILARSTPGSRFVLNQQQPSFTYVFVATNNSLHVAGVEWEIGGRLKLAIQVGGESGTESSESPVVLRFRPEAGAKCTMTVSAEGALPAQGIEGDLRVVRDARPGQPKYKSIIPPEERYEHVPPGQAGSPLVPLMVNLAQRYLQGTQEKTDADLLFERTVAEHPEMTRESIQSMVDQFDALPASAKARAYSPQSLALRSQPRPGLAQMPVLLGPQLARPAVGLVAGPATTISALQPGAFAQAAALMPRIERVEPGLLGDSPYLMGTPITLVGKNFSPDAARNWVLIGNDLNTLESVIPKSPASASPTALQFEIPSNLADGLAYLMVMVEGRGQSNARSLKVAKTAPAPGGIARLPGDAGQQQPTTDPMIHSVVPTPPHPGETLYIHGENFRPDAAYNLILTEPGSSKVLHKIPIRFRNAKLLNSIVEQSVKPGRYDAMLALDAGPVTRQRYPINVDPGYYRLTFLDIQCVDETNPEWWGGDEIAVITEVLADRYGAVKVSELYEPFDDWVKKPFREPDISIAPRYSSQTDKGLTIADGLGLVVTVWEWDSGEPSRKFTSVSLMTSYEYGLTWLKYSYDNPTALGDMWAPVGLGADLVGNVKQVWTAVELQQMLHAGQSVEQTFHFRKSDSAKDYDDTGYYRIRYKIERFY